MGIMYNKGTNYSLLKETYKVPVSNLDILKGHAVSLKVGDTAIALDNGKGVVKEHSFNTLISNTVKNPMPQHVVEVNAFISTYINLIIQNDKSQITPPIANKVKLSQSDIDALPVVHLRDAKEMYQRVLGTSGGSVYRVIAMNDNIKVAARIKGNAVSLRVEGVFDTATVQAFNAVGVQQKTEEYLSGHFTCEKCTPQKLIGSVIVGCGVIFDTPVPNLNSKAFA